MRFALRLALKQVNQAKSEEGDDEENDGVVRAFDVNLIANQTYEHNFHNNKNNDKDKDKDNSNNDTKRRKLSATSKHQKKPHLDRDEDDGSSKVCSLGIDYLTSEDLDRYRADLWMLSPPCQPYTSLGLQKGSDDARANSFLHLMTEVLPRMNHKPKHLLVENVPGFEASDTHQRLVSVLR